jgi:lipid-binding SYLF domain-containing protein
MLLLIILLPGCATTPSSPAEQQRLVEEAALTFERFLDHPENAFWYRGQQKSIKAVLIVPRLVRGAFVVGAAGGNGVLLARDFVNGGWSPPAFYSLDIGSVGLQAGADVSEVILIVQSFAGLERFYGTGTFRLGLDAGLTTGTVGEGGTAGRDIVTFASSKGLFGGISLDGMAITASEKANEAYYGNRRKPEDILPDSTVDKPGTERLRGIVGRYPLPD